MEDSSLPDDCVHQVGVAIELILDEIVQHLQEEEYQIVVGRVGDEEPWCGEGLDQV